MKNIFTLVLFLSSTAIGVCQDSLLKIHHAEPLYIDLIRDLGARKGEREWNAGWGISDQQHYLSHTGFVEYEFSPINRLGMEVEIPFSFYQLTNHQVKKEEVPRHRVEGIKLATQYTFLVSAKWKMSLAAGYMNELKLHSFQTMSDHRRMVKGNAYSPFFIAAKRWGRNVHSMVYTGPIWEQEFSKSEVHLNIQVNASMHCVFPGTAHFVGMEINHESGKDFSETTLRPQAKIKVTQGLFLGIVTGIPLSRNEGLSGMIRIIYEPKKK